MDLRTLGANGPTVSAVGFGCMGLSQGYGPADDAESRALLRLALDEGITFLDTAMSYGMGHNEELLGTAIAGRREEVVLASKFGIVRGEDGVRLDGAPQRVRGYCTASLATLGVDHLDLYYLHRVDPEVPIEDTVGAMAELVAEGKVRHLGLSEVSAAQLRRAAAVHPIAAVQSEWSLTWREIEDDVLPAARELGIGVVAYGPLGRGLLTGTVGAPETLAANDMRRGDPRFHGEPWRHNLARVGELAGLAERFGVTSGQLALAWLLARGEDVVPIPGTRRAHRLRENIAATKLRLGQTDLELIERTVPRAAWAGDRASFAVPNTARG